MSLTKVSFSMIDGSVTNPVDYGAVNDGTTNDTTALQAAVAATPSNGTVVLSSGSFLAENATSIDTNMLSGEGVLLNASGITMYPRQRKSYYNYSDLMTLEDEYQTHSTYGGYQLNYTGFCASVVCKGAEYIAVRCGYSHAADFTKVSKLIIYKIQPTKRNVVERYDVYTSSASENISDVNITMLPNVNGSDSYAVVKFAEELSTGGYQTRMLTLNLDDLSTIVKNQIVSGISSTYFTWGNTLMTPSKYILICTYREDGNKIQVWKSTTTFATGTENLTFTLAEEVGETSDCFEPTIGFWNDRYVMVYRKNTGASRCTITFDLENGTAWYPVQTITDINTADRRIYAPACLAYSNSTVFTLFGTLGTNRKILTTASSNNPGNGYWYTTAVLLNAGDPTGGTNGYPSISDFGSEYAVTTFSDIVNSSAAPTRFERQMIPKTLVDVSLNQPSRQVKKQATNAYVATASSGVFIGDLSWNTSLLNSAAQDFSFECLFKSAVSIKSVYLLTSGTTTTATVEIYEDSVLIATSSTTSFTATAATPIEFAFGSAIPVSLGKKYVFKITSSTNVALYDYRHNNQVKTQLEFNGFSLTDMFNASGGSISTYSLVVPSFKI